MQFLRKAWEWFDARTDASKVIGPILKHPVPPRTGWMYVFGSATLFAFLIQVFTGIALATAYVSSAGQAYDIARSGSLTRHSSGISFAGCITSAPPPWCCSSAST